MTTLTATADQRFWDRTAPGYAKRPVADEEAYRLTLERVRSYLTSDQRVLEVGCGTGTTALHLAPQAAEIVATDLSPRMLDIARAKAEATGVENVAFVTGALDDLDLAPESFQVVMAFNVIHLFGDIPGTLRRVYDLLPPGGLFVSKTPCLGDMNPLVRLAVSVMRAIGKAPFVNFLKKSLLRDSVWDAGFTIVETGLYPAKSQSLFIVARKGA